MTGERPAKAGRYDSRSWRPPSGGRGSWRPALAGLALAGVFLHAQEPNVFRGGTDLVAVDVSATRNGRPVRDLRLEEFEIYDSGTKQAIRDVTFERLPVDLTIALDISASVSGSVLDSLRRAVQDVRADLRPGDRIRLMTFNMRVSRAIDFTESASAIDAAFARIAASGSTALFDLLSVALAAPSPPDRRHLIVAFSDGNDTASITEPVTLIEVAQATAGTLAFVVPPLGGQATVTVPPPPPPDLVPAGGPPGQGSTLTLSPLRGSTPSGGPPVSVLALADRMLLTELARETGGDVVSMLPNVSVGSVFRRVLDDFRSSYVLHFAPQGVAPTGVHALDVKVTRSGVAVRARKSYVR